MGKHIDRSRMFGNDPLRVAGGAAVPIDHRHGPPTVMPGRTIATITQEAHHEPQRASGKHQTDPKGALRSDGQYGSRGETPPRDPSCLFFLFFHRHHTAGRGRPPTNQGHKETPRHPLARTCPTQHRQNDTAHAKPRGHGTHRRARWSPMGHTNPIRNARINAPSAAPEIRPWGHRPTSGTAH